MKKSTLFTVTMAPNKAYCLTISENLKNPKLFYATKPYSNEKVFLDSFSGSQMWIKSPDSTRRIYFAVESENHAPLWAASTQVEIDTIKNFRDMGGYKTLQGNVVKWGSFYRSGTLKPLKKEEKEIYEGLNISHIFDYRTTGEMEAAPDSLPKSATYYPIPAISTKNNIAKFAATDIGSMMAAIQTKEHADQAMDLFADLYRQLPFQNPAYAALFKAMDDAKEDESFLQHCSAGKDRTGVGCALTLLALGVDEQTVMEDYLLSGIFRFIPAEVNSMKKYADVQLSSHAMEVAILLSGVAKELLAATFETIKKEYPSYEEFFLKEYGITFETLNSWREKFTISPIV